MVSDNLEDELNLPMMEKIKLVDALPKEEQQAIFKVIDLGISNKKKIFCKARLRNKQKSPDGALLFNSYSYILILNLSH
jgi:hypothetical protein